jgi:hypothetical protein
MTTDGRDSKESAKRLPPADLTHDGDASRNYAPRGGEEQLFRSDFRSDGGLRRAFAPPSANDGGIGLDKVCGLTGRIVSPHA